MYNKRNSSPSPILFFVALIITSIICIIIAYYSSGTTIKATITDTEIFISGDGDGGINTKYLVFTDIEVFENRDELFRKKFNSSDFQNEFKSNIGSTYEFTVLGWRIPFFSMYRNIVTYKKIDE